MKALDSIRPAMDEDFVKIDYTRHKAMAKKLLIFLLVLCLPGYTVDCTGYKRQ